MRSLALIDQVLLIQTALNPPEWMIQYEKIRNGEATWDDFTFEERTCKGWLWPYLLQIDSLPGIGSGRWNWWIEANALKKLPDSDIPRIDFLGTCDSGTQRMLEKCLDTNWNYRLPDFLDWILWGFGEGKERPRIDTKTNEKWYRTFNLGLMIQHPTDYWGDLYSETKGRGSWNRSGFYPTPHPVCNMLLQMTFHDEKKENPGIDTRLLSFNEPCCGTGRILMETSNYSVDLSGMDIDYVCIAASKINGYLYVPWLVRPAPWVSELREQQVSYRSNQTTENIVADIIKEINPIYRVVLTNTSKTGIHRFTIKNGPAKKTQFKVKNLNAVAFRKQYEKAVAKRMDRVEDRKAA